jgi:hypothetical protein
MNAAFQAALAAIRAADQRLLGLHDAGADDEAWLKATDAKTRAATTHLAGTAGGSILRVRCVDRHG